MADVGLGQYATSTGIYRMRAFKDAISDNIPMWDQMEKAGGIIRVDGGSGIQQSALTAPNATATWVGPAGQVPITDSKVLDSALFPWYYQLASVVWTLAEKYQNSGGRDTKYIDIVDAKYKAAEITLMNQYQEAIWGTGTGYGGLQAPGLGTLVSTTPSVGTVGGINRADPNAAWFRNQKFDTSVDWTNGATSAGNIKQFIDRGLNATIRGPNRKKGFMILGDTHWNYLNQATQAIQVINDNSGTAKVGFDRIVYRGVEAYYGGGINYSGYSQLTPTRTYIICCEEGGFNIYFHEKAEFEMLEPVNSQDQAAVSRLLFAMSTMTVGGLNKFNWVGFD